jgi:hypothetical protein
MRGDPWFDAAQFLRRVQARQSKAQQAFQNDIAFFDTFCNLSAEEVHAARRTRALRASINSSPL